jgi:Glycosyltransferase family 87
MDRSPVELLFFQNSAQSFTDLTEFDPVTKGFRPIITISSERLRKSDTVIPYTSYRLPRFCYPAAGMCDYLLFTSFPHPVRLFLITIGSFAVAAAAALLLILRRGAGNGLLLAGTVLASLLLSYPLLFLLERGNIEGVVWAVEVLGLTAFVTRRYWSAGLLLALAAAMKVYPAIFLTLLLYKKRYREVAVSVVAMAVINIASLWILGPTIAQADADIRRGLAGMNSGVLMNFRDGYVIAYDHSLFAGIKQGLHLINLRNPAALGPEIQAAAVPYLVLAVAGFAVLYWFRLRQLPLLNQILVLTVVDLTFPFMSQEYTLVHLYFPWALLLIFLARDVSRARLAIPSTGALIMLGALAFLFAPTPHQYLNHSITGQMQLAALIALGAAGSMVPMRSSIFGEIPGVSDAWRTQVVRDGISAAGMPQSWQPSSQ